MGRQPSRAQIPQDFSTFHAAIIIGACDRCLRRKIMNMGRNLYILAGTLLIFAMISFGVSYTNIAQQPGSPGDTSLWRTMGLAFFFVSMVISLAAVLSSLFEQAERHTDEERRQRRHKR
jgi:hypothetical protein